MSETTFNIREVRAYSTKQRPNPTTIHGPYPTREAAMDAMRIKASNASRNDNRSNWYVEEALRAPTQSGE